MGLFASLLQKARESPAPPTAAGGATGASRPEGAAGHARSAARGRAPASPEAAPFPGSPAGADAAVSRKSGQSASTAALLQQPRPAAPRPSRDAARDGAGDAESAAEPRLTAGASRARRRGAAAPGEESASESALATLLSRTGTGNAAAKAGPPRGESPVTEALPAEEGAARRAKAGAGEALVTVPDLRRNAQARRKEAAQPAENAPSDPARPVAGNERELTLDLGSRSAGSGAAVGSDKLPGAVPGAGEGAAPGRDLASLVAERLADTFNGEIVKTAHIVLKDGDSGTIRLRLRPESLGSVKIELNLADNNISGRIVVESDEAKSAFERSMADLRDAFHEGCFESASLEVSVGSDGRGPRDGASDGAGIPFWSERRRDAAFDSAVPPAVPPSGGARDGLAVDILA